MDNNFFWDTDPQPENQPRPAEEPAAEMPMHEENPVQEPAQEIPQEPVWHNETREGAVPPPPAPAKKSI